MIFDRLAIGTANWSKEYNSSKVSEDDQKRILDYCMSSGIDTIHTSKEYEWDYSKVNSYFRIIVKETDCISVYNPGDIPVSILESDVLMIPYSIYDRRFEQAILNRFCEIHVCSIYLRGKILEKFLPAECIIFCLMNVNIDKVIIGIDNFEQLKDALRPLHRINSAEKHDINLLDTRKWK